MRFTGRRVFLTGATGFIGGVLARKLLADGAELTCLVRPKTDASRLERAGARVVRGDVTEPATLDLSGQHLLVHAAAWVGYGLPSKKRPLLRKTNVGGTENVLHAAKRAGVAKVVHVSSVAALGGVGGVVTEETPRGDTFLSDYERTKTEAHALALSAGLPSAVPTPGLVVGREGPFENLMRALAKGRVPALPGDDAVKGFVHVEDCAEGILLAALKGSGAYLLVDENVRATELFVAALEEAGLPVPRRRVASALLVGSAGVLERAYNLAGKTPPVSAELLQGLRVPMTYDSGRARKELGWRPSLVARLSEDLQRLAKS
jgi:nucleoside-diphosphate-sugar epimerase